MLLKKQDLFLTVIPSKIFESMAMKKPIVLGVQGELADAVARLADSPELCRTLGESGYQHVAEHFDRSVLAALYEGVLAQLVADSG